MSEELQKALEQQQQLIKVISHTNELLLEGRDGFTMQSLAHRVLEVERELRDLRESTKKRLDMASSFVSDLKKELQAETRKNESIRSDLRVKLELLEDKLKEPV